MMNQLLNNLNDRQKEAVQATEGRVRIVAGAGSGKTRVIAHRYAFLVNVLGIDPGNILCMTFTNKAAQEMKRRISSLVAPGLVNDFVCTIHGFCVKFLRKEIHRIGFPKTFTILDDEDKKAMVKRVMEAMNIDRTQSTVKKHINMVGKMKGALRMDYVGKFMLPGSKAKPTAEQQVFYQYLQEQLRLFAVDIDDQMYFTIYILHHFKEVREQWQAELNYLQIDEVQDCDADEWELFTLLSEGHGNLCVVGDPDQAIYEWRGSRPQLFVNFEADVDVVLNQNYRSTPDILDVANAIIANNRDRVPKDLFTEKPAGVRVVHYHASSDAKECKWIADTISKAVKKGKGTYGEIAILFRAAYLSRGVEQELIKLGIPYAVWGGIRFFERKEIKDALSYLRLIANPADDLAFLRVCNVPSRKFGRKALEWLTANTDDGTALYETLATNLDAPAMARTRMQDFVKVIEEGRELIAKGCGIGSTLDHVLTMSGLKEEYRTDEDEDRLENIHELLHSIKEYEASHHMGDEAPSLDDYLQDIALYTNADYRTDEETVRLMTIHQAKGLEFPYVFVMGLNEGVFPSHRAIRERLEAAEEEERRLMYVAVTRAERELILTESEGFSAANQCEKYPSRFLKEIPDHLITVKGRPPKYLFEEMEDMVNWLNAELGINRRVDYSKKAAAKPKNDDAEIRPGDTVEHMVFGLGTVEEVKENGSCVVQFPTTRRTLLPRVLKKQQ
ncbi:MAG: ATP-dependent helicase [Bacteroidales bacterium]|nr:ATP-dependent helicase [Bacteroidales bacterium]